MVSLTQNRHKDLQAFMTPWMSNYFLTLLRTDARCCANGKWQNHLNLRKWGHIPGHNYLGGWQGWASVRCSWLCTAPEAKAATCKCATSCFDTNRPPTAPLFCRVGVGN